jgi:hypothetical protein
MNSSKRLRELYLQQSAIHLAELIRKRASDAEINSAINVLEYDIKELRRVETPWRQREAGGLVTFVTVAVFISMIGLLAAAVAS